MVPPGFTGYFAAAAGGAGVLIGLLFVAVSLRPETIFGAKARAAGQAQAGSAFISLANCFSLSLVALIPQTNIGVAAIAVAVVSTVATLRLHREVARHELQPVMLSLSLCTFLLQFAFGLVIVIGRGDESTVSNLAYLQIALFGVALGRAWSLAQGKHLNRGAQHPAEVLAAPPVERDRPRGTA